VVPAAGASSLLGNDLASKTPLRLDTLVNIESSWFEQAGQGFRKQKPEITGKTATVKTDVFRCRRQNYLYMLYSAGFCDPENLTTKACTLFPACYFSLGKQEHS